MGEALTADGSGAMFDRIAKRYDRMNRIISLGFDRGWRRKLLRAAGDLSGDEALDVATGTADVAIALARRFPDARIVGLDPSRGMLEVGARKVARRDLAERVDLVEGDAMRMPFADARFAAATIAFGIRNVPDREAGLREMARVVRPGGRVCVLELSEPRDGWLRPLTRWHVHHVVPRLGAWLSGEREYRYLQESVAAFPPPEAFAALMARCGLTDVTIQRMPLGVAHLYVGQPS